MLPAEAVRGAAITASAGFLSNRETHCMVPHTKSAHGAFVILSCMKRINFKDVNKLISVVTSLDESLGRMSEEASSREEEIRNAAADLLTLEALDSLEQIPVEELRNSKSGIRVNALKDAGYLNLKDLALAEDEALRLVSGIGEKQTASIRAILAVFGKQIAEKKTVRLSMDDDSERNLRLIRAVAVCRLGNELQADAAPVREQFHTCAEEILSRITVRGNIRWLFTGRKKKEMVTEAISDLTRFAASPLYERAGRLAGRWRDLPGISSDEAKRDFEQHGAEYYVLLEKVCGKASSLSASVSNIPSELAARINSFEPDLSCFTGSLRGYQEFGVKYILHQKRVLLGDDMGLGKTIQAIAAMSHLYAGEKGGHFLVVCPAGVLVNWCREIRKFSTLPAWLLHGEELESGFSQWKESGGVAVTNYESMVKIIKRINNHIRLLMMVIDEAHYIKNPEAMRTRYVYMLEDESENILLMTGTPLENRVSEMCSLIGFIRPDLLKQVKEAAALSRTEEFREMISPVYLRRQREEVLQELPPVEVKEEWCRMTEEDRREYVAQIMARNFTASRRVGFLQKDLSSSSKAERLKELCAEAESAGRKTIIYSYFRDTITKVEELLKDRCAGVITGSTPVSERQEIVDRFADAPPGSILICQVQAGGTGLNIQAASIVIFCEPQIKPSLIHQAIARAWRMGQVRNVMVHHLLCEDSVDDAVIQWLEDKQLEFDLYADESAIGRAADEVLDSEWIHDFMEREHSRYLPAAVPQQAADKTGSEI